MLVLGRDIIIDRLYSRMCFVGKRFSQEITSHDVQGVPFVLKSEDKIISTVLQYHSWLETVDVRVTARAHVVRRVALLLSRDATSHSRRVFRL